MAASNFANLASGETGIRAHNLIQNKWKRNLFSQNWSYNRLATVWNIDMFGEKKIWKKKIYDEINFLL